MTNRAIDVLSTIDRKEIQLIGKDINDTMLVAEQHAKDAIVAYLKVGELLHEARQFFKGDKEYGQWRAENTTLSQSWANKLSRVWDTYGKEAPASLPISTLAEMTNVSEAKRKELEKQAEDPEQKTPSVRDVKQIAKEEKAKTGDERVEEQIAKRDAPKEPTESLEELAQTFVNLPFNKRAEYWDQSNKSVDDAFILMGLPPYFEGEPNIDTMITLTTAMWNEHKHKSVNEAYAVIKEFLK